VAQHQNVGPIAVWNDPGSLTTDAGPDATFGHASNAVSVIGTANRLFAFRSGAIDIYASPATLASGASPIDTITSGSLGSFARPRIMGGHLWVANGSPGSALLFAGADTLTSVSSVTAEYTHQWGQISDAAYLPGPDRLLGTQVSGAGLLAYDAATSATGTVEEDWTFSDTSGWSMALAANSLYVSGLSGGSGPYLRIYRNASAITTTSAPTIELTTGLEDCLYIGAHHGRLVMSCQNPGRIYLFLDASAITTGSTPDITIDLPAPLPRAAVLDADDNLYVLDSGHVYIYSGAATTPALQATLDTSVDTTTGLWLLE
jgi:hypothetical protein